MAAALIAIGFLVLYLTITGKIDIFAAAFRQAFLPGTTAGQNTATKTGGTMPKLPSLPRFV
jgi:hypothetical protein